MKQLLLVIAIFTFFSCENNITDEEKETDSEPIKYEKGWTEFKADTDTRIIYVSDSEGDDSTAEIYTISDSLSNPFLPEKKVKAFKTIQEGWKHLRDGKCDFILLKRGDQFRERLPELRISGKSADYPLLISAYGPLSEEKPQILVSDNSSYVFFTLNRGKRISNFAFVSIDITAANKNPESDLFNSANHGEIRSFYLGAPGENILIEDCHFRFVQFTVESPATAITGADITRNVTFRRSIISDHYVTPGNGLGQGMYIWGVSGLLIEESIFDHNGWSESVNNANPTIFNHNMYINWENENVVVKNNIISRGGSHGLQLRCGGEARNNLFLRNAISLLAGIDAGQPGRLLIGKAEIIDNIIMESRDISSDFPRGMALEIQNLDQANIRGNIISRQYQSTANKRAITFMGDELRNINMNNNIVYDWKGTFLTITGQPAYENISISNNIFQDPNENYASIEFTGSLNNYAAFTFSSNKYKDTSSGGKFIIENNQLINFNSWVSNYKRENGSSYETVRFSDPNRTVISYMLSIGKTGDYESFIAELKKQRKGRWRKEFKTSAVNQYIRNGFILPDN